MKQLIPILRLRIFDARGIKMSFHLLSFVRYSVFVSLMNLKFIAILL